MLSLLYPLSGFLVVLWLTWFGFRVANANGANVSRKAKSYTYKGLFLVGFLITFGYGYSSGVFSNMERMEGSQPQSIKAGQIEYTPAEQVDITEEGREIQDESMEDLQDFREDFLKERTDEVDGN